MRSSPSSPPDRGARAPAWLTAQPYAHRGLHGIGVVENSRAAFEAAIAAGHGIELDVQASREGEAVVFHDYDLPRLTGRPGRVAELGIEELRAIPIAGTGETIPALIEIVHLVNARVPLLIEVKAPGRRVGPLCASVLRAIREYGGFAAVMSFNPAVGHWFYRNARGVTRGLVVTESGRGRVHGGIERRLSLWRARPHFLAYDVRDLPSRFARAQRARGLPILTWTVRGHAQRAAAAAEADQIIYEAPRDE